MEISVNVTTNTGRKLGTKVGIDSVDQIDEALVASAGALNRLAHQMIDAGAATDEFGI